MWFLCPRWRSSRPLGANGSVVYPPRTVYCRISHQKPFCCPCLRDVLLQLCRCCLTVATKRLAPIIKRSEQAARITFLNCMKLPNPGFILSTSHRGSLPKSGKNHLNWTAKGPKSWKPSIWGKILSHQDHLHIVWLTHHFKEVLVKLRRLHPVHTKAIRIFGITSFVKAPNMGNRLSSLPSAWNSLNRTSNLSKFVRMIGSSLLTDSFENILDMAARRVRCKP